MALLASCGPPPEEEPGPTAVDLDAPETQQPVLITNALLPDEIVLNGVTVSGVLKNSLSASNLTFNSTAGNASGTNRAAFERWFVTSDGGDKALHDRIMKVIVACGVASGSTVKFTHSGTTWTWSGKANLAGSDWQSTAPTEDERERISACFYAHAKTSSSTVQVSVRSNTATFSSLEKEVQWTFDGAFFGDMTANARYLCRRKTPDPLFGILGASEPPPGYATTLLTDWGRRCYNSSDNCGGIFTLVDCESVCTKRGYGSSRKDYVVGPTCTVNGRTFDVINAFLPRFKTANGLKEGSTSSRHWSLSGATRVACTNCADGNALKFTSASTSASSSQWSDVSGGVTLMIRYAATAATSLQVQLVWQEVVNGVTTTKTKTLMNGTSPNWSFTATGSSSTWRWKTIGISSLPAKATIKLLGPTSGTAPLVDTVAMRD